MISIYHIKTAVPASIIAGAAVFSSIGKTLFVLFIKAEHINQVL